MLAVFVVLILIRLVIGRFSGPDLSPADLALQEGDYEVLHVVNGHTLDVRAVHVDLRRQTAEGVHVRLLGIDCSETVQPNHPIETWRLEASAYTRQFVSGGRVHLRFDRRRVDQDGRYLAYLSVAEKMLNEELVRAGLARVCYYPGDSQTVARRLRKAEQEARQQGRGIWSDS